MSYDKEYYEAHKDKFREYQRKYYKKNEERYKQYRKKYNDTHKEKRKQYYLDNIEKCREASKRYIEKHKDDPEYKEKIRISRRKYYAKNKEAFRKAKKRYKLDHRDVVYRMKAEYYRKRREGCQRHHWDEWEDEMVLEHKLTDTEISKIIKHSVAAIQARRHNLKKIYGEGVVNDVRRISNRDTKAREVLREGTRQRKTRHLLQWFKKHFNRKV